MIWQHLLPAIFLFHDDLGQHAVGDILARFGVEHLKLHILAREFGKIIQRDIFRCPRVVEAAVRIFLYDDRTIRSRTLGFSRHCQPFAV
jgi:hypothetical protein